MRNDDMSASYPFVPLQTAHDLLSFLSLSRVHGFVDEVREIGFEYFNRYRYCVGPCESNVIVRKR